MRKYSIIQAPFGIAASILGCEQTPKIFVEKHLSGLINMRKRNWSEMGKSYEIIQREELPPILEVENRVEAVKEFSLILKNEVLNSLLEEETPIIIGGDHSISVGSLSAMSQFLFQKYGRKKLGVIWVDSHADMNDNPQGNPHGKPLAIATGMVYQDIFETDEKSSVEFSNIAYIGVRDLMPNENKIIQQHAISFYDMNDIEEHGVTTIIRNSVHKMEESCDGIFLSFDIDACDGILFPGSGTPEIGGLTAREARVIAYEVAKSPKFLGMDLVELNLKNDVNGQTKELAVKIIDSILGFRS